MEKVTRGDYCFIGPGAKDSAKFFDIAISNGYDGDLLYLAWESAHKFGQRMTGPDLASYRDGIVKGENALAAAEYVDLKRNELYDSLPKFNRSRLLKEEMKKVFLFAMEEYGVLFEGM